MSLADATDPDGTPAEPNPPIPPRAPDAPPDPDRPTKRPNPNKEVWGRAELLESIGSLTVSELIDLYRRAKIVLALNGLSPEYREMSASERLEIVDQIMAAEDGPSDAGATGL